MRAETNPPFASPIRTPKTNAQVTNLHAQICARARKPSAYLEIPASCKSTNYAEAATRPIFPSFDAFSRS